jgi:hypothetical protein
MPDIDSILSAKQPELRREDLTEMVSVLLLLSAVGLALLGLMI